MARASAARAEFDAACERTWDAEARYEEPERPRWHPVHEEGGYVTIETRPGYGFSALDNGAENIAYLRDLIAREHEPDDPASGYRNKVRARRARKTLAKIEAWSDEFDRRRDAAGLTRAEAEEEAARSAAYACRAAIVATEATTLRDLGFKAALVSAMWGYDWSEGAAIAVVDQLADLAGVAPHAAA